MLNKTTFIISIILVSIANSTTWYISTSGSDNNNGTSENEAFATIQYGINESMNGDTVLVLPGTYVENINFVGKNIVVGSLFLTSNDTSYISQTIIDGNQNGTVVRFVSGEDSTCVLIGLRITNGLADYGGGIECSYNSSPTLKNLVISGNNANIAGGGIDIYSLSNPVISNVTVFGNSSPQGGGVYCSTQSDPILNHMVIFGNTADRGAGISCLRSNPIFTNVTISGNTANIAGGGIYCVQSSPRLNNAILWSNSPEQIYSDSQAIPDSIIISYSDIQGGEAGIVINNNGVIFWLEGNMNANPFFVDETNEDYNLLQYSPCIDTGHPDLDGDGITWENDPDDQDSDGTRMDMGAFYYDQEENIVITFLANTSGVPDTLHENSSVQIRGSLPAFGNWDANSPAYMTNIGGDYWAYTIPLSVDDISIPIVYKYVTSPLPQDQLPDVWHGWEGGATWILDLSNFTGTDTVLELGYVRGWADVSPGSIPFIPTDSIDVFFRVNMQAKIEDGSFDPDSQIVSIRGSNTVDWGQTGDLSWTQSVPFNRENIHINGEVGAEYDGTNFWAGRIRIPNQWFGQELQYKFVYHDQNESQIQWEEPLSTGGLTRSIILPIEGDTTIHWVWWNDENPFGPSQPNVWHVSKTGSDDTGNGSEVNPFATIQYAVDRAYDGNTVMVFPGIYSESLILPNKSLSLIGLEGFDTTFIVPATNGPIVRIPSFTGDTLRIAGFTFTSGYVDNSPGTVLNSWNNFGTIILSHCMISENHSDFQGNGGGTIYMSGNGELIIEHSTLINNTASSVGETCSGIVLDGVGVTITNVLFDSNINQSGDDIIIHAVATDTIRINNCTFTRNKGGILVNENSFAILTNVICYQNNWNLSLEGNSGGIIQYCNIQNRVTTVSTASGGTVEYGEGILDLNPLFTNSNNGDFTLSENSPCIDTGHPDLDRDGITWENDPDDQDPDGTRMDMGAFFYPQFLTNTTISSNPDTLSIVNPMDTIVITFSVPFDPATVESNIEVNGLGYGSFPFEISLSDDNRNIYISPNMTYPLSDMIYITLKQGIISSEGYAFDYDSDGLLADYDLQFITPLLGDFNSDFSVNFDDFIIFRDTWWEQDKVDVNPYELHPYFGTPPFVIVQPDFNFAYDELITFIWMWNWSHTQNRNMRLDIGQKVVTIDSRIKFIPSYLNRDPWGQNLSIPIELELTIDNPGTVSSVEIILSFNPDELSFDDLRYASSIDCDDCDWINLEYIIEESNQVIMNMVAFNKDRLLQPGTNLLNSINFNAHVQDSTTIRYYYDVRYYGETVNADVGSGKYTLKILNPLPEGYTLKQNFPNPFNPVTTICYSLPKNCIVNVTIYDLLGRHIKTLINQAQDGGYKSVIWNATNEYDKRVSAGVYLYQIRAGEFVQTKKMVLLK